MTEEQKDYARRELIAEMRLYTMADAKLNRLWEIADAWFNDLPEDDAETYKEIVRRLVTFGRVF